MRRRPAASVHACDIARRSGLSGNSRSAASRGAGARCRRAQRRHGRAGRGPSGRCRRGWKPACRTRAVGARLRAAARPAHGRCRRSRSTSRPQAHAVLGERAGLVDAQHGGRAKGLDDSRAPRQHLDARETPRAEREEHGQRHREFLRQHRHAERDRRQHALHPVAALQSIPDHEHAALVTMAASTERPAPGVAGGAAAALARSRCRRVTRRCGRPGYRGRSASTSIKPWPETARVLAYTWACRRRPAHWLVASASGSCDARFRSGTDSPVSSDSSTARPDGFARRCRRRRAARLRQPEKKSPGTSSRAAMRRTWPPRTTRTCGEASTLKASSACSLRRSWKITRPTVTTAKKASRRPSPRSPSTR